MRSPAKVQSYKNFREIEVLEEVRDWKLEGRGTALSFKNALNFQYP